MLNIILEMVLKKSDKWTMFFAPYLFKDQTECMDGAVKSIYLKLQGTPREEGMIYGEGKVNDFTFITYKKIPVEVYRKLIAGQYSTLSDEDKEKILAFWNIKGEQDMLYYILYPYKRFLEVGIRPKRKNLEIWPKPSIAFLTLKQNNDSVDDKKQDGYIFHDLSKCQAIQPKRV